MVTRWSRSTSHFNALTEFMQKIYAASGNLLLIAEADRVLCHLVMFLIVVFHWMYRMEYICFQDSSNIHVCLLVFWLRIAPLVKVMGNPISDGIVFLFHLT